MQCTRRRLFTQTVLISRLLIPSIGALASSSSKAENFGYFHGTPKVELLDDGKQLRLLESFGYTGPDGRIWVTPKGWIVDGASIPQVAWSIVAPLEGPYRNASIIHDFECDTKRTPWEKVHEVFYFGMLSGGTEPLIAKIMYAAVFHFGPRWTRLERVRGQGGTRSEAELLRKLLNKAIGKSTAIIVERRHLPKLSMNAGENYEFDVEIRPPTDKLDETQFRELEREIRLREQTGEKSVSLLEIRQFGR